MKSGWMIVAALLFALMGMLVKQGSTYFSSGELVFYRSVFGLVAIWLGVAITQRRGFAALATAHYRLHAQRSMAGFVALVLFFHTLAALPLATAITLNYTAPLFLAALSAWWLHERHGRGVLAAVALGFVGVACLLRPVFDDDLWLPAAMGLASGFLAAVAYVNIKRLSDAGEPEWRVVFHFTLFSSIGGAAWMVLVDFHPPRTADWPLLAGIGVTATVAQLALTRAYARGRTLVVGALAYTTVGFSALGGVWVYDETLPPVAWLGMALVAAAGILATRTGAPR